MWGLTEKQEDIWISSNRLGKSAVEIARNLNISRRFVHDSLVITREKLFECEHSCRECGVTFIIADSRVECSCGTTFSAIDLYCPTCAWHPDLNVLTCPLCERPVSWYDQQEEDNGPSEIPTDPYILDNRMSLQAPGKNAQDRAEIHYYENDMG